MAYILSPENRHQTSGRRTVLISVDVMQPGNWQSGEQKEKRSPSLLVAVKIISLNVEVFTRFCRFLRVTQFRRENSHVRSRE
jgi:hypothetical protein